MWDLQKQLIHLSEKLNKIAIDNQLDDHVRVLWSPSCQRYEVKIAEGVYIEYGSYEAGCGAQDRSGGRDDEK